MSDGPLIPKLLKQILPREILGTVNAYGAYDPRACHAAIAVRQATAVIPTQHNARAQRETTPRAQARNEILLATRRKGRTLQPNWLTSMQHW